MHEATRTENQLAPRGGRSPARILAASATAATVLLVVLGCASGTSLITPGGNQLPPDPTFTPGPISTHEVANTVKLVGGDTGPVVATCPTGELALSGGWDIPPTGARVFAARLTSTSWAVSVAAPPPSFIGRAATTPPSDQEVGIQVTAYVECLRGAGATVAAVQRSTTKSIAPTTPSDQVDNGGGYIGACQASEGLAGFGFDFGATGASHLELEASLPSEVLHAQTWSFRVWNHDTVAHDAIFTLQCLTTTGSGQVQYAARKGAGLYANTSTTTAVDCPTGAMTAGGGFAYSLVGQRASYLGNEYSHHVTATGWQSAMIAFTSYGLVPVYPQVAAVCMTLA
jgi:hypothetical protein